MNKVTIADNRTGEILDIEYNSNSRKYSVNSIDVIRQQPLESNENEFVFSSINTVVPKLYHVLVEEIKSLWKA